jgi:methylmalonyl-CoA mutase
LEGNLVLRSDAGHIFDNCNSLHTNAFDEAITTPTPESVRRAVAIPVSVIVGSSTRNWG